MDSDFFYFDICHLLTYLTFVIKKDNYFALVSNWQSSKTYACIFQKLK